MSRTLAAALLPLISSVALAATLGSTNPALVAEIDARLAALPGSGLTKVETKQKKALERGAAALADDAADARAAVADARKVVGALDKAYPGDVTLDPLLAALVAGVTADVQDRLDAVTAGRDGLPDGKTKSKVTKKVAKAVAALMMAAGSSTRVAALKAVAKAVKQVAAGEKVLAGAGGGGSTSTEFDMDIGNPPSDSVHYPSTPAGALDHYTTIFSPGPPGIFTLSAAADGTAATYAVMFFVLGPGAGDHAMTTTGSGLSVIPGDTTPLTSGTVRFTTWNPGSRKCAGTFSATFGGIEVSGSFSSSEMILNQ